MSGTNPGLPTPGQLYADVLWNTALLPDYVKGDNGLPVAKQVPANTQYLEIAVNPLDQLSMIARINTVISARCYQDTIYNETTNTGFNCLQNAYVGPDGPIVGQNIPSRYVVMGGRIPTGQGLVRNQADQLLVTAVGQSTYLQTDWREPPNYTQSPVV